MLTKIETTTASSGKQIALDFSTTNNTVVYTVPEGKTCTGYFFGRPSNNGSVSVNNVQVYSTQQSASGVGVIPFVLVAGTVLKARGSDGNAYFVGVES